MAFEIEFMPDAWEHLQSFSARHRSMLLSAIEVQLSYEPHVRTRKRSNYSLPLLSVDPNPQPLPLRGEGEW